jgi:hypothetical protein
MEHVTHLEAVKTTEMYHLTKEEGLRSDVVQHTEFADRMMRAVCGKNRCSRNSSVALFDDLVSPSLEAFALLLCKNGHENWVWMHNNVCLTSDVSDDTEEECPLRTGGDFTSRNGGWSRDGMSLCNKLHKMARWQKRTRRLTTDPLASFANHTEWRCADGNGKGKQMTGVQVNS